MGLFSKLFNNSSNVNEKIELPWKSLNSIKQLDDIKDKSRYKPQLIFKHSTRCGISRMVLNTFVKQYNFTENQADLYYLDLLAFRDVSNEVTTQFDVFHQSPQLLVIKNGAVVTHESHGAINDMDLSQYV